MSVENLPNDPMLRVNPTFPAYFGQVATRSFVPNSIYTGFKSVNSQTVHTARERISALRLVYANWYSLNAVHEAGSGGTAIFSASIQYPIAANPATGTWQSFKWNGSTTSPIIADGAFAPETDLLNLLSDIPAGASFLLRTHVEASNQAAFWQFTASNLNLPNQLCEASATPGANSDKTTGGVIAAGTTANNIYPVAIIGQTKRPSLYLLGDSRVLGQGDTADGTGHTGELARSLGEHFAYMNAGCASEQATTWLPASTRRQYLMKYFSHIVGNLGINDLVGGRTSAQVAADISAIGAIAKAQGKKVLWNTLAPSSTGTWATLAGQTTATYNANRAAVNNLLRSRQIANIDQVLDGASGVESSLDSGLWTICYDGTAGVALTNDGLHATWQGYQLIRKAVDPQLIYLA